MSVKEKKTEKLIYGPEDGLFIIYNNKLLFKLIIIILKIASQN